jgi:hypothetical protein
MGHGMMTLRNAVPWFTTNSHIQIDKREDPYAPQQSNGCCIVM